MDKKRSHLFFETPCMFIVVAMAITAGMATLDVMDVMVCITLIAAMSTFCLEALVAAMLEPNCSDNCGAVMAPMAIMAPMAFMAKITVMAIMVVIVVMPIMNFLITWTCLEGLES